MKIIKEGTVKPKIYIFECDNCGCMFEMDHNDPEDMDGMFEVALGGVTWMKAQCPTCRHRALGFQKEEDDADS